MSIKGSLFLNIIKDFFFLISGTVVSNFLDCDKCNMLLPVLL